MFDTSLVKSRAMAAPRRYGLLSASIALHSGLAVAAIAMSIATIEFPDRSPDQAEIFRPMATVVIPPPLGDGRPPRPATVRPAPANVVRSSSAPPIPVTSELSPAAVPAPAEPSSPGEAAQGPASGDPGTGGDPNGEPGGVGTDPVVVVGAPNGGVPYTPGGEVRPARVLTRVEPRYPPAFSRAGVSAIVKIQCIIDSRGRIRQPEIVLSSFPPFNQSVLDAVERWTFSPGTLRGQPVDTYFELTVTFRSR